MTAPDRARPTPRGGRAIALLALLLAVGCPGAKPAPPAPNGPTDALPAGGAQGAKAAGVLDRMVRQRCTDPNEPWAVVHGLLCYGPSLRIGQTPAVKLLTGNLDPRTLLFPKGTPERPIEPHPGMAVKTFLEIGVPRDADVELRNGKTTTWAAVAAAQAKAFTPGGRGAPLRDQAWQLELVAQTGDPRAPELAARSLKLLAENQAYFQAYADDPAKPYDKPHETGPDGSLRPIAIHRYFCGGFHLFQAVQRLHGRAVPPLLAEQYRLVWVRLDRETAYWRGKLAEARERFERATLQGHERLILSQLLKLQGHALETVLRAYRAGALALSAEDRTRVDDGFVALGQTVADLEACGAFDDLDAIRRAAPQLYLDLVGDGAHALHAFMLSRGS